MMDMVLEGLRIGDGVKAQPWMKRLLSKLSKGESGSEERIKSFKEFLFKVRKRAQRQGVWRRLNNIDKGIINLSIYLPHLKFRAEKLLSVLIKALKGLMLLVSPLYRYWIRGVDMAYKISEAAYRLGNKDALRWRHDKAFIIYWGMMLENQPFVIRR